MNEYLPPRVFEREGIRLTDEYVYLLDIFERVFVRRRITKGKFPSHKQTQLLHEANEIQLNTWYEL